MLMLITNVGKDKLANALSGGQRVEVTHFSVGFTSGSVSVTDTVVPGQLYGPVPINSSVLVSSDQIQYECIVPEPVGPWTGNVLGLFDSSGALFAIGKSTSPYNKIPQSLPNEPGNRISFKAQVLVSNVTATINLTVNPTDLSNIPFVATADALPSAVSGLHKTYRVVDMPDTFSDIATSDGTSWSFLRYEPEYIGTTSGSATVTTEIVGDSTKKFRSDHVGGIVESLGGVTANQVRIITAVNAAENKATVSPGFSALVPSSTAYKVSTRRVVFQTGSIPFASPTGKLVEANALLHWDNTNRRLGNNISSPEFGYHQLGGSHRLQQLNDPTAPTVTPQGTPGSTTYTYYIVARDQRNKQTNVSPPGVTTTGNSSLGSNNFNRITWTAIPGAVLYDVLKTNTTTLLGSTTDTQFDDIGQITTSYTPPTRNETADLSVDGSISASSASISGNALISSDASISGNASISQNCTANVLRHTTSGKFMGQRTDGNYMDLIYVDSGNKVQIPNVIPSGTKMIFRQSTAPVGWTRDSSLTPGSVLRYISGGTVTSGGSADVAGDLVHSLGTASGDFNTSGPSSTYTADSGGGAPVPTPGHFHSVSISLSNVNVPAHPSFRYIDVIIATKD